MYYIYLIYYIIIHIMNYILQIICIIYTHARGGGEIAQLVKALGW